MVSEPQTITDVYLDFFVCFLSCVLIDHHHAIQTLVKSISLQSILTEQSLRFMAERRTQATFRTSLIRSDKTLLIPKEILLPELDKTRKESEV